MTTDLDTTDVEDDDFGMGSDPEPNPDQAKALEDFFQFLLSPNKFYHLTGGAGFGKTFTLNLLMSDIMERYKEACKALSIPQKVHSVHLTATTNKAAEVLATSTNRPASTIHSFLNLIVTPDFNTGKTKIRKGKNFYIHENELIIIDEASMIDSELFDIINTATLNCKILYVGDHNQMSPVMEKLSRIYEDKTYFSNLTIPMRNSGQPALMALCEQLRETVETGVFKPIEAVPGVIDYLSGSQMKSMIDTVFLPTHHNARILCFTNNQVKNFNQYIREMRGLPEHFTEGEILVSANAYQPKAGDFRISVEQEVEVDKVFSDVITKNVQGVNFDVYEIEVRTRYKTGRVPIPVSQDYHNELIKYFAKQKNWSAYYHLKDGYPDLRPRDASTVYKAQGSTYDMVFVDLEDISTCTHADQTARMLYVACSRARTHLYLYGQLKPAYRGG